MVSLRGVVGLILAIALAIGIPSWGMISDGAGQAWAASSSAIKVTDELTDEDKDFSGQSIIGKEFVRVQIEEADFTGADLRGTVFSGSSLSGSNFHGANLSDVIMYTTDLRNTDLTDANLTSILLLQTNLDGADITGADFSYSTIDRPQLIKLCARASGVNPITGVDTRESLECR
ncbi:MAG: pentapeptide repeat-containing protein [Leptolyngbyaceae bacterium]|nr:pentapeptide repeat-containing protein [Leptolyngbyaceae bacterium]